MWFLFMGLSAIRRQMASIRRPAPIKLVTINIWDQDGPIRGTSCEQGRCLENTVDRVEKEIGNGNEDEPQDEVFASNDG